MSKMKLNETVAHALTCKELKDMYIYYIPGSQRQMGIVLNVVGQLFGLISNSRFVPFDGLSDTQKGDAQKLVASALERWGDVVHYNEHSLPSSSSLLVSRDHTLPIAGYDFAQPFPNNISPAIRIGASHINGGYESYDHTQPSTTCPNAVFPNILFGTFPTSGKYDNAQLVNSCADGTLFDILKGKYQINGGYEHRQPNSSYAHAICGGYQMQQTTSYSSGTSSNMLVGASQMDRGCDHMQPCTSYANATLSNNLIGTSEINGGCDLWQQSTSFFSLDCSSDTSHDKCAEMQLIAAPEDTTPLHDTFSHPFGNTSDGVNSDPPNIFGLFDDFQWGSTMFQDYIEPGFSIDNYFGPDERLKIKSYAAIRKWQKMRSVLRFSHRMTKSGHARKRMRLC